MSERSERWEERYLAGDLPWDTGRHDSNLERTVATYGIMPCRALDIGCGHGSNAIWLAQQGFDVDATDLSPTAIERAKVRAVECGASVHFESGDILVDPLPRGDYGFIFDRGCFHSFDDMEQQQRFARLVREALAEDGWWLSLIGNADDVERSEGPPKRSAHDVVEIIESLFEIHLLRTIHFDSNQDNPPRAWACLSRPRQTNGTTQPTAR
jgi:SAM-dependent methyltransferase